MHIIFLYIGWGCTASNRLGTDVLRFPELPIPERPFAVDYCTWSGVYCDTSLNVIQITLVSFGIGGTIPTTLAYLYALTTLDLSSNGLTGTSIRTVCSYAYVDLHTYMHFYSVL